MKKLRAFTLIELLIVVVIIGILATFVAISLLSARSRAADGRAKDAISKIRDSVEIFTSASDNGVEGMQDTNCNIEQRTPPVGDKISGTGTHTCNGKFDSVGAATFKTVPKDAKNEDIRIFAWEPTVGAGYTAWVVFGKSSNYDNTNKRCFYYRSDGVNNLTSSAAGANSCVYNGVTAYP